MMVVKNQIFHGWRVVAATFVLAAFGWGVGFYGPPVYLHAMREARGWLVGLVSLAVTVHFLCGAVVVANLPVLYRRLGVPRVTKAGAVLLAVGVTGWALAEEPWQLFAATLCSGAGWVALGAAAVNAIIAPWFARTRPAALAMAYNGASIGGVIFSPLWVMAIGGLRFPVAAMLIGGVTVLVVWVLADIYFARTPQQMGLLADGDTVGTVSAARTVSARPLAGGLLWRDWRFLSLAAGMACGLFAQIGLLAHLFSLLVPALGATLAGVAMGSATAAAILCRSLVGWFMPIAADRRPVASVSYPVQILGSVMLFLAAGVDIQLLVTGVILFGVGIGHATSLPPLIAQVEFPKEDLARVVPLIVAMSQAAYAFAPAAFALMRDAGAVAPALFVAAALIQGMAIFCFLAGRRR